MYMGEGKRPTREHLLKLAQKHGLKKGRKIVEEVKEAVSQWHKFAKTAGVTQKTAQAIAKAIG
jgi:serine/threonine-protein kinase HipA